MSRLTKTRGIVIRHSPYSESSRIVQWITEDHGRLTTIAKGAMRPRSQMLSQFDQLYTCELIYYAQEREAVYVTREVSAIRERTRFRTDWRAAMAGCYLTDLTARAIPHHEPAPELYHLLDQALNELHLHGWSSPMLFIYELRLLHLLGLSPKLDVCATCRRSFQPGEQVSFSPKCGGMVCSTCSDINGSTGTGADVLAILNHWQRSSGWNVSRTARCSERQLAAIRTLLGDFVVYHMDIRATCRTMTMNMLFS
jgi:DNA repair protein RecO (recombination protein O)